MKSRMSFPVMAACLFALCLGAATIEAWGSGPASGAAPSGAPTDVVARIGDVAIDRATFEAEFARSQRDTTKPRSDLEARQEFMESLVNRYLLVAAAREAGYFEPDSTRDYMIKGFEDSQLITMVRDREVRSKIEVTPEEVEAYHAKSAELFDMSQIIVATREEAEAVMKRFDAGEDFATVAREVSLDIKSSDKGGQVPPFAWGMTSLSFLAALDEMKPGEIRGPIESEAGYHIIQLHGMQRNPNYEPLNDGQRPYVEYRCRLFKEMELTNEFYAQLKERYHFSPNWPAVNALARIFRDAVAAAVENNPHASREDQEEIAKRSVVLEDSLLRQPIATWDSGYFLVFEDWQFVSQLPGLAIVDRRNPHFIVGDAAADFYRAAQAMEARAKGYDKEPELRRGVERKREEIAVSQFYTTEILGKPQFTAAEEREYYEQHPDQFIIESQVKLACLQYQADPAAAAAMEDALRGSASPDSLLKEHMARGLIRTQTPEGKWFNDQQHPIIFGKAWPMKTGEIGRVIDEEGYWTVFVVLDHQEGRMAAFDEVKKTVQTSLRNIKADEILKNMLADLRVKYPVWVDPAYVRNTGGSE